METVTYIGKIQAHAREGDYHAALNRAHFGLNPGRNSDSQNYVNTLPGVIEGLTQKLITEFREKKN